MNKNFTKRSALDAYSPSQIDAVFSKLSKWHLYSDSLCNGCMSLCCRLPVEVTIADLARLGLVADADSGERLQLKKIARQLTKEGIISSFRASTGLFTLAQKANGDCCFLDSETRRCTVYENRPDVCRSFPRVGPRVDHCPMLKIR